MCENKNGKFDEYDEVIGNLKNRCKHRHEDGKFAFKELEDGSVKCELCSEEWSLSGNTSDDELAEPHHFAPAPVIISSPYESEKHKERCRMMTRMDKTLDRILKYDDDNLLKQFEIMGEESKGKGREIWNGVLTWDDALMCIYAELGDRGISIEDMK